MKRILCTLALAAGLLWQADAREVVKLSGPGWKLWRDTAAQWQSEHVVVPGTPLDQVTVHLPTGGWDALAKADRKDVSVPGTVEQYFTDMSALEKDYTIDPKEFWQPLQGVSWWSKEFKVDQDLTGKKVFLRFCALRFQAEIYLNHELVACDSACDTEFTVDVTGKLKKGDTARLDVRITNPGGDYDWMDYIPFTWNGVKLNSGRAVGGITGHVTLEITDPVYIDDVFVMNTPDPKTVEVRITAVNDTGADVEKECTVMLVQDNVPVMRAEVFKLKPGENLISRKFTYENAELWDLDNPNLYTMSVKLGDESQDQTFGFRWFGPEGIGKDAMFRLNGKRIVLRSAISWGWWPVTGTIPLPEYAAKQIKAAKDFGMNMLNFHRHMGQNIVLDEADKQGLLYYAEPGGFISGSQSPEGRVIAKERVRRMVKMFRSHPSLCIYNLINELGLGREQHDQNWYSSMVSFTHQNDPSRIVVLTSGWSKEGINVEDYNKMNCMPFDDEVHLVGFRDNHNAPGPLISYPANYYTNNTRYWNYTQDKEEIIFWGEEGAISTPPRLELIQDELKKIGQDGMDGEDYKNWYKRMNKYLDEKGLRKEFPTVEDFTVELGKVGIRHQGRRIEIIRLNNITDGYAINGWEAMLRENHSGVVDTFRNPKSDPAILRAYNAPLKLAVHTATPTFTVPNTVSADIHIINEVDMKGDYTLVVEFIQDGKTVSTVEKPVKVTGGDVYGELLAENVSIQVDKPGVSLIKASLKGTDAAGDMEVVAVDVSSIKLPEGKTYAVYENPQPQGGQQGGFGGPGRGQGQQGGFGGGRGGRGGFGGGQQGASLTSILNAAGGKFQSFQPGSNLKPDVLVVTQRYPVPQRIQPNSIATPDGNAGMFRLTFLVDGEKRAERNVRQLELSFPDGTTPDPNVNMTAGFTVLLEGQFMPNADGDYNFKIEGPTKADDQLSFKIDGKEVEVAADGTAKVRLANGVPAQMAISMTKKTAQGIRVLCFPPNSNSVDVNAVLELAKSGTQVIILNDVSNWAPTIAAANGKLKYLGDFRLGNNWVGGQYFCKDHPVFDGFTRGAVLDYPFEAAVSNPRTAIIMEGDEELIAGAWHSLGCRMGTAIGRTKVGSGSVFYSTLGLTNYNDPACKRLLFNLIEYAAGRDRSDIMEKSRND
ncbi:MAG: hypothetical protein IKQ82_04050 [Lentisphaeria bacterium]|nr:hypothetical protein [Lentisphaeria bacterium]